MPELRPRFHLPVSSSMIDLTTRFEGWPDCSSFQKSKPSLFPRLYLVKSYAPFQISLASLCPKDDASMS